MKYAVFNEGLPLAFYALEIHGDDIPADAVQITEEQWLEFLNNQGLRKWVDGEVVAHEILAHPTEEDYRIAIQRHVDAQAQTRRYDSGNSLASYVASTNETWAAEAQAFVAWRDAVWRYAYAELARVLAGEREQPSVRDFIGELPEIEWPSEA